MDVGQTVRSTKTAFGTQRVNFLASVGAVRFYETLFAIVLTPILMTLPLHMAWPAHMLIWISLFNKCHPVTWECVLWFLIILHGGSQCK